MKFIWQLGLLLTALTLTQSFGDPEDSNVAYDKPSDLWSLQWKGQDGNTYFIQKSYDMINWSYLPHVDIGSGSSINWNFQTNSDRFFLRLKHTDIYTEDPEEEDFDNDQIPTLWELENGLDPLLHADGYWDADSDGLRNNAEFQAGTSPTNADTDGDTMPDGYEVDHGLNATANDATTDLDGDSVSNINEYQKGTKPNNPDSDGDGNGDGEDPQPNDPSNGTARAPSYVIVPIPNSNGFSPRHITDTSYVMLRNSNDSDQIGRFKLGDASVEWVDASGVSSRKFLTEDGTLWATKSKTSPGELVTTITPDEPEGFTPDHHEATSQASRIVNAPFGSNFGVITVDGDLSIEMNVRFTRKDEHRSLDAISSNGAYQVTTLRDTERLYYISHLNGWVDVYANLDEYKHDFKERLNGVSIFKAQYEERGIITNPYELVTNTITGDRLYHFSGKGLVSNKGHVWLLEGQWTQDRDGVSSGGKPFLEHPNGSAVFPDDENFLPSFLNDDGASIGSGGLMLPNGQVIGRPGNAMDSHPDGDWTFIGDDIIAKRIPEVDANGNIVKDAGSGKTVWTENFKFIPINPPEPTPDGNIAESVLTQSQLDAHGYKKVTFNRIAQNGLIAGVGYKPDGTTEVLYAIPVEVDYVNRDNPEKDFLNENEREELRDGITVYAGNGSGDHLSFRVELEESANTHFKWRAVPSEGYELLEIIEGPNDVGANEWNLIGSGFDWIPGKYDILLTIGGSADEIILRKELQVGWRTEELAIIGQILPFDTHDISLIDASLFRLNLLKGAIRLSSEASVGIDLSDTLAGDALAGLSALAVGTTKKYLELYAGVTAGVDFSEIQEGPLGGEVTPAMYLWGIQTFLNDNSDEDLVMPETFQRSFMNDTITKSDERFYRVFAVFQANLVIDESFTITEASPTASENLPLKSFLDNGPTKLNVGVSEGEFFEGGEFLGVELPPLPWDDFTTAIKIDSELSSESGLKQNSQRYSLYASARIAEDGQKLNWGLTGYDAPWIFVEPTFIANPQSKEIAFEVRTSVDITVDDQPSVVSGTCPFNEIKVYKRNYDISEGSDFLFERIITLPLENSLNCFIHSIEKGVHPTPQTTSHVQ